MAEVMKRKRVPISVNGHTLVMTSRFIFSHVFSLPSALEVMTNEVIKKTTVSTEEMISGAFRRAALILSEEAEAEAEEFEAVLLELILSMENVYLFPRTDGSAVLIFPVRVRRGSEMDFTPNTVIMIRIKRSRICPPTINMRSEYVVSISCELIVERTSV
jgi:hypothetical protein